MEAVADASTLLSTPSCFIDSLRSAQPSVVKKTESDWTQLSVSVPQLIAIYLTGMGKVNA